MARTLHQCQLLNGLALKDYSLKTAANFAKAAPCTNRPVACPVTGCEYVVWSYSMADHFEEKHASVTMPEDLARAVALRRHEKEGTRQLLHKSPKNVVITTCAGSTCPCKLEKF